MSMLTFFKYLILVQAFYAVSITMLSYTIVDSANPDYIDIFRSPSESINLVNVTDQLQGSLERQTNIPVIDVGALVFYSGNIVLDLLLNFSFALPQMLSMLVSGVGMIFGVDAFIMVQIQLFITIFISAMYLFGLLQLITGLRSGRFI